MSQENNQCSPKKCTIIFNVIDRTHPCTNACFSAEPPTSTRLLPSTLRTHVEFISRHHRSGDAASKSILRAPWGKINENEKTSSTRCTLTVANARQLAPANPYRLQPLQLAFPTTFEEQCMACKHSKLTLQINTDF
jgi:hypothetical protein